MKKQLFTFLLALLLLLVPLTSCAKDDPPTGEQTGTTDQRPQETDEYTNDRDDLPADLDLGGQTFTIFSIAQWVAGGEFEVQEAEDVAEGSDLEKAVFERNTAVQDRLNCVIENVESLGDTNTSEMYTKVEQMNNSGSGEYQLLVTASYRMSPLAVAGFLTDLAALNSIDLGKDYYSQGYNEALSMGDAQYLLTGTFTMGYYRYLMANMFSKKLFNDNGIAFPYELVREGEWTFDKMHEITQQLYRDLNGDSVEDTGDQYGYVIMTGNNSSFTDAFMSACDLHVLTKSEDNYYEVNINASRYSDAMDKILELLMGEGTLSGDSLDASLVYSKFANNTAGMITTRLYGLEDAAVAEMGQTPGYGYGIVPVPKLDAAQQDYYSYVQDQCFTFGISSWFTGDWLTEISQFLECFASESYHIIKPAFYDKALTLQYVSDPDSVEMLDMIGSNVVVDPVNIYNNLPFNTTTFRGIYASGDNTVSSMLASQVENGRLREAVEEINNAYRALANRN